MSSCEEGEYSSLSCCSSENESPYSGQAKVLPVGSFTKELGKDSVPICGEEYLCQVRYQANNYKHLQTDHSIGNSSIDIFESIYSSFKPIIIAQSHIDRVIERYNMVTEKDNSSEIIKQTIKDYSFEALCKLDLSLLKPSQISDLRKAAKESDNISFIALVAICFGQRDLIKIE